MKKRTIYITLFLIFIIGVISLIGTFAIDSSITEGNSNKADYLFNITLGDRTNREIVIPGYDSKIVDIKISNPNEFNMAYLLYLEGVNSNLSIINISNNEASGVLNSKTNTLIKVFIQNNSSSDITTSIKDIVGFEKEKLSVPSNNTSINKGTYYKVIVKSNDNTYGKVKPNIKLSTLNGTVKYEIVPNTGYKYKSTTCTGSITDNILTISNITSNINCEVVFEPIKVQVNLDLAGGVVETTYTEPKEYTYTVPATGTYKIELWGAQGLSEYGGKGGYTKGEIKLNQNDNFYVYVGGTNGYNGGGSSSNKSGGGATDVRLTTGTFDNFDSLKSRIMVAAGGGAVTNNDSGALAGNAGGLVGYDGVAHSYVGSTYIGTGASQSSGGKIGSSATSGTNGTFGIGGTGGVGPGDPNHTGCGGGGGYYGGGASAWHAGSGGGSSYISGHNGCDAISSNSTEGSITHSGQSVHYSGKVFTNTVMIDGQGYSWTNTKGALQRMPNPSGGYYASGIGNSGNGVAKITLLNSTIYMNAYNTKYEYLPIPTKSGYVFLGWYTEPNGQGTKVIENTILTNTSDHTLYANWQINTYTITYDYRNNIYNQDTSTWILSGNNSHVDNTYSYNGTRALYLASSSLYTGAAIPLNGDKKQTTNYKLSIKAYRTIDFSGNLRAYAETLDSTGNVISWNHGISVNTSNLSLNTWKEYNYSFNTGAYSSWNYIYIDYDTENQGPVYVSDIRLDEYTTGTVTYDTNYTNLPTPTRTGYTFLGWYTGENGTGTKITSESIVSTASDHTLYAYWQISDTTAPTCTLRASAGSTTITATVSDTGGSGIAGKGFSTSYGGETTKTVSSTGTIKYYVKDGAGNTGTCSATISATTENCDCGAGFPQSGACYIGIIENGKWVGNRYYKECDWTYTCSSGTKLSNSYCFKAN